MTATILSSIALGALVGMILGLTGAGGAILAVPVLVFVMNLSIAEAAPVGLLAVGLSAGIGALIGLYEGNVRYKAAALMSAAGALCSPVGVWLAHRLPNAPLALAFAILLTYVAVRMFRRPGPEGSGQSDRSHVKPCRLDTSNGRFIWSCSCASALTLIGGGAGFLSGVLGVGGGFVIVPALKRETDAPMSSITSTSLAVIAMVSVWGVLISAMTGNMAWRIGLPFAAGAVLGMFVGRALVHQFSGQRLQQGFAFVAGCAALAMVIKVFGGL